jgi:hypothetical protein
MTGASPEQVEAGHAFYTRRTLPIYDPLILGWFSRTAWRCPASRVQEHYDTHLTGAHLDVGVGTGYFLDHARFPVAQPRLAILDPNQDCLDHTARRLARFRPELIRASVLEPIDAQVDVELEPFSSVALNHVLHCLPGDIRTKGDAVFAALGPLLAAGAVVFGGTLLHEGVRRSWYARQIMRRNNAHGIFSNDRDDLAGLEDVLARHLANPVVDVVGCVALFSGVRPT